MGFGLMGAAKKPKPVDFAKAGAAAYRAGDRAKALNAYAQAVQGAPKNRDYKIQLCTILQDVSFQSFNPTFKTLILECLKTSGIDYLKLSKPWFSLLLCNPEFAPLRAVYEGKPTDAEKLSTCVSNPYFQEGLKRVIVYDMRFEAMLLQIKDVLGDAFDDYAARTEYIFCDEAGSVDFETDESIPVLSSTDDVVSGQVQEQYEENPYPRWHSIDVQSPARATADKTIDYLVAGCGTGHGLCGTAVQYPKARITAFDLSRASLTYAKAKAMEFGSKTITFYQADILDLDVLDQQFDIIECSGVLHHMADPIAGWRSLLSRLKPKGRMHIGLYSEAGRRDVVAARAVIAEQGFEVTHAGIQAARSYINALPEGHAARGVLSRRDFYSLSDCRDLLFHVCEHRFTVEGIEKALQTLGLEFDGPQSLDEWRKMERDTPDAFRGMFQFWCKRRA